MSSRLAFQTQLASIMEVLANAAVAEICKLVDDDYAVVSLQMSQCQRENKALKRKLHLLELKMARGAAERRLRDSAANSSRPRVQIRGESSSSSTGGAFERHMDVSLWSSCGAAVAAAVQPVHADDMQCKSPDVQLVEPEQQLLVKEESVEANKVEEMEEEVSLIGHDGVLERVHRGASGQRTGLEQDAHSQTQTSRTRPPARSSRGVEKEEEPDVVLVKVEEAEPPAAAAADDLMGLSIQEGLVESSTDDYRGALAVDEATPAPINRLPEQRESDGGFSEVSYGCSSLWTNGGSSYCHDNSLPSSHCAPLSFMPGALPAAESATSRRRSAGESSGSFRASFEPQHPVIDLSEESNLPAQASGHSRGGQGSVQGLYLDPGPSQSQGGCSSVDRRQQQQQQLPHGSRKRVWICRYCGKGFMSPAGLDSHTRTHTGERPYVCIVCGKKFSQAWNLKIHTNIHTGQRPYPCTLCPERFSDPSNLKKHQKRLHPQS